MRNLNFELLFNSLKQLVLNNMVIFWFMRDWDAVCALLPSSIWVYALHFIRVYANSFYFVSINLFRNFHSLIENPQRMSFFFTKLKYFVIENALGCLLLISV